MELTQQYQYLGRSNGVGCPAGYFYYLLLYARAVEDREAGAYRVDIKTRMACSVDASFYAFTTTGSASVDEVSAYRWSRQQIPAVYWGDSSPLTEGGVTYPRWTELYEGSTTVTTGFGEDNTVELKASWVMNSTYDRGWFPNTGETALVSAEVTLPALAGVSQVTLSKNTVTADGEDRLILSVVPGAPSLSHRVEYLMGENVLESFFGITTGHSYPVAPDLWLPYITDRKNTLSLSDAAAPAVQVTPCNVFGNAVGSGVRLRFDITVPERFGPKITITGVTPVNPAPAPFEGLFLQGITGAKVSFTANSDHGAEIKEAFVTVEGGNYGAAQDYTCQVLSGFGEKTVKVTATDSRGFTAYATARLQVIPYTPPRISARCQRAEADGTAADSGSFVWLTASASVSRVPAEGENQNSCKLLIRWGQGGSWSDWVLLSQGASFEGLVPELFADPKASYILQLQAKDGIGAVLTELSLGTEEVYMHRTANALGLGKYVEGQRLLDCAWDAWFRGKVYLGEAGQTLEEYITSIIGGGN